MNKRYSIKIVYILLFALYILLANFSCGDDIVEDMTVTLDKSGKVKIKIVDFDNNPLEGSVIDIYENNYPIMQGSADINGIYDIGKLLQGNYYCNVVARKGRSVYTIEEYMLIAAKDDFVLEINPLRNSGIFDITVTNSESGSPIQNPSDYKIVLLTAPECYKVNSVDFLLENAHFIADLDSNANALIPEIPLGKGYRFFLHNRKTDLYYVYIFYNIINKGETKKITIIDKS